MKIEETGTKKARVRTRYFENFAEYLEFAQERPATSTQRRSSTMQSQRDYTPAPDGSYGWWSGTETWDEAIVLARDGWAAGLEMVEAITARFEAITSSKLMKPQVTYDVAGDCVDIGRYVSGEPENMMVWEEVEAEGAGRIVRVQVDLSTSAGITSAQMAQRGAAACALVDALETCGKTVELTATVGQTGHGGWKLQQSIPIKAAGEPLEMDRLAFMLVNAAMYRRLGFATWENEPKEWWEAIGAHGSAGYGMPVGAFDWPEPFDITVPNMLLTSTPEKCVEWVFAELKRQGVSIEGSEVSV